MSRPQATQARQWADFFRENHRTLTHYALALVGRLSDAQDLIQDVLVRMVEQDRPVRNARPFILRCMRNLAIDRHRAAKARATPVSRESGVTRVAFVDAHDADPVRREDAERVKAALEALPDDQREVIILKVYVEITFREISEILDRPLGTVTSNYARGLDRLRGLLNRELKHVHD